MRQYLNTLESAFYLFPIIAALITIPYVSREKKRFGGIPVMRCFLFYTFVLYITCCYVLVLFPLPDPAEVAMMPDKTPDLRIFGFITDIAKYSSFVLTDPSTWKTAFHESVFYQALFNLVMTIPFGIYLRYYFKRGLIPTIFFAFLLSLSFEMLQLTGILGLYEKAYRYFQVDDLILNTSGAALGWIIAPLITWMFPKRENIDRLTQMQHLDSDPRRRVLAAFIDLAIFAVLSMFASRIPVLSRFSLLGESGFTAKYLFYCLMSLFYFVGLSLLFGDTPGKKLTGLTVVTDTGKNRKLKRPSFKQYLIHYGLEMVVALPAPFFAVKILSWTQYTSSIIDLILYLVMVFFLLIFTVLAFQIVISLFTGNLYLWSESMSETRTILKKSRKACVVEKRPNSDSYGLRKDQVSNSDRSQSTNSRRRASAPYKEVQSKPRSRRSRLEALDEEIFTPEEIQNAHQRVYGEDDVFRPEETENDQKRVKTGQYESVDDIFTPEEVKRDQRKEDTVFKREPLSSSKTEKR